MSLRAYQRKRDFTVSPEPTGRRRLGSRRQPAHRFVVQKHAAKQLHYDFRLELGGTLKSWAVPKGIPFAKGEKRLAVEVEDHPIDYIDFEGTIPQGQYGGGTVMLWDHGTFEPHADAPLESLRCGKLHFTLSGQKLRGEWYLVRLKEERQWLLIRAGHSLKPISKAADDRSVASRRSMAEISQSRRARTCNRPSESRAPTRNRRARSRPRAWLAPQFIPPMLARPVSAIPTGDWQFELKFDGYRALLVKDASRVELYSRNGKSLLTQFPTVAAAAASLKAAQAVIDGEIVAVDPKGRISFQQLQSPSPERGGSVIRYFAFDLLQLDGADWQDLPFVERKAQLELIIPRRSVIRFSPSLGDDSNRLLDQIRLHGLEGLIGKRVDSRYEAGLRTGAWIKLKVRRSQEVVIGGYTVPKGGRLHFGALLVGVYQGSKLHFVGKVGSGFTVKLLKLLRGRLERLSRNRCPFSNLPESKAGHYGQGITRQQMNHCRWVLPTLVGQVSFHEWTRDGKLRQPVFLGLREDKRAHEVTREDG